LPRDLSDSYFEDWVAELRALENRPLTAIRYANRLATAARIIAVAAGGPITYSRRSLAVNRLVDVLTGALAITLVLPVFGLVALGTRLATRGPVLARRPRLGKDGVAFDRLEFARSGLELSRWRDCLELTALHELPILVNVVRGDMALIGPPPQDPAMPCAPLKVRPGLASWELLASEGYVRLTLEDARFRDQRRRARDDVALRFYAIRVPARRGSSTRKP